MAQKLLRFAARYLFSAMTLLLFCPPVPAQDNYFGIKGGISIPRLSGGSDNELSRDYKSKLAPNFGGFYERVLSRKLSFQAEINFAGQGGRRIGVQPISQPIPGLPPLPVGFYYYADFKNVATLNYLEFPVLGKYRFNPGAKKVFYVDGGLFYGYLVNAKTKTRGSSTIYLDKNRLPLLIPPLNQPLPPMSFDAKTDIMNDVHRNNFGLTGGGGFEFPHKDNYFFIDLRIAYGLLKIQKDTVRSGSDHTGNLLVSAGYAFMLK